MMNLKQYTEEYDLTIEDLEAYVDFVEKHRKSVYEYGVDLGVDRLQLVMHDLSKFESSELPFYALYKKDMSKKSLLDKAFSHHIHHNPHHWQYWIFTNSQGRVNYLEMPRPFILEMIADWQGASKVYSGNDDITDWLYYNAPIIKMNYITRLQVTEILNSFGYTDFKFWEAKDG